MSLKKRLSLGASAIALTTVTWIETAYPQAFLPQGPSPTVGFSTGSRDIPPLGTASGALTSIVLDPNLGASTAFVASPNGGIWRTTDAGSSWAPLIDKQSSLSITSLSMDSSDLTGKTLIAGTGLTDNGEYSQFNLPDPIGRGSYRDGLILSTDGGNTWNAVGRESLANQSISDAHVRGLTILAATFEPFAINATSASSGSYGVYRSLNGGQSFSLLSGTGNLPAGAVSSLVADPTDPRIFYAAVTRTNSKLKEAAGLS